LDQPRGRPDKWAHRAAESDPERSAVLRKCEHAIKTIEKQMLDDVGIDTATSVQIRLETFVRNLRGQVSRADLKVWQ
jgi:hypothetical protein